MENALLHRERPALTPRPAREWGNLKELLTDEHVSTHSSAPCSIWFEYRRWKDGFMIYRGLSTQAGQLIMTQALPFSVSLSIYIYTADVSGDARLTVLSVAASAVDAAAGHCAVCWHPSSRCSSAVDRHLQIR